MARESERPAKTPTGAGRMAYSDVFAKNKAALTNGKGPTGSGTFIAGQAPKHAGQAPKRAHEATEKGVPKETTEDDRKSRIMAFHRSKAYRYGLYGTTENRYWCHVYFKPRMLRRFHFDS